MVTEIAPRRRRGNGPRVSGERTPSREHGGLCRIPEGTLDANPLEACGRDELRELVRVQETKSTRVLEVQNPRRIIEKVACDGPQIRLTQLGELPNRIARLELREAFDIETTDVRIPAQR